MSCRIVIDGTPCTIPSSQVAALKRGGKAEIEWYLSTWRWPIVTAYERKKIANAMLTPNDGQSLIVTDNITIKWAN